MRALWNEGVNESQRMWSFPDSFEEVDFRQVKDSLGAMEND